MDSTGIRIKVNVAFDTQRGLPIHKRVYCTRNWRERLSKPALLRVKK